jgi:urease accessory protein
MTVHSYFNRSRCLTGVLVGLCSLLATLWITTPALAHHPMGGNTPSNFFEGLMSGLGHPVIGVDHFAFVVASGLLAALTPQGLRIPIAFALTSLLGTGLHLMSLNLPVPEILIATSVLIIGGVLALKNRPNSWLVTGFAALAGVFHGYAYGESIVGAEISSLVAYLVGFTTIQLAIATVAYQIARSMLRFGNTELESPMLKLRFAGFIIFGAGLAFLSSALL